MAPRTRFLFIAASIIAVASVVAAPTDAFAKKGKAVRAAQVAVPAPLVIPDSNIPADRVPRCFDSVIRYPSPPCY